MTVKDLETIGFIRKVNISKKINNHSNCFVEILLKDSNTIEKLREKLGKQVCVEDSHYIYMRGIITEFHYQPMFSKSFVIFTITSNSLFMEEEKKKRIFQKPSKTYYDILKKIATQNYSIQILESALSNKKVENCIVQADVSDFEFVLFLAKMMGVYVFVNDTNQKCVINLGISNNNTTNNIKEEDFITLEWDVNQHEERIKIKLRMYYEFGTKVNFKGFTYLISAMEIFYENKELYYEYVLLRSLNKQKYKESHPSLCLGLAKVIENNDPEHKGRIQVEYQEYKDELSDERSWIPYITTITEKNAGIILIPDVEEMVYVYMSNGICYADGCLRQMELNESYRDISKRSIAIRETELIISKDEMQLKAYGFHFLLDKEKAMVSKSDMMLSLSEKMIEIRNKNSKINMDSDRTQIITGSEVDIKSGKIVLDGNSKIEAKTNFFDIG